MNANPNPAHLDDNYDSANQQMNNRSNLVNKIFYKENGKSHQRMETQPNIPKTNEIMEDNNFNMNPHMESLLQKK